MRLDSVFGNVERGRVWECAFQAIADLNEHLPVLRKDEQHNAITLFFLSNAPRLRDALCIIGDIRIALHFRKHRDHDLVGSLTLKLPELFVETISGLF